MKLTIDQQAHDQRLDRFLRKRFPKMARGEIYRLMRTRPVRRLGKKLKENDRVYEGDELELFWPGLADAPEKPFEKVSGELTLAAVSPDYVVAYKPVGLKTIPDQAGEISLSLLVQSVFADEHSDTFRISPVSRLDRNTAGLVLFGRSYHSLKRYNELMRRGQIRKFYFAIIFGTIIETKSHKVLMKKDPATNQVTVGSGVMTETLVRPIASNGKKTLVEVELITGKSHQIRALMQHLGHPIEGDPKYGRGGKFQWLWASRLEFDGEVIEYHGAEYREKLKKEFDYVPRPNNPDTCQQLSI